MHNQRIFIIGLPSYLIYNNIFNKMMNGYQPYSYDYNSTMQSPYPYRDAKNYNDWDSIFQGFPELKDVNQHHNFQTEKAMTGIVIRSANDDNVHKAVKYGIWTTTPRNRNKIQQLWQRKEKSNINTYLFFSAVKSGMFEGVARLKSNYHQETFPFWWENHTLKFKGYFEIEWVYIKDVNNKHFTGLYNQEGEDITKSKDCDIIDSQTTKKMLQIFDKKPLKRNIFMDFAFMDERETQYIRKMHEMNNYYNQYNYNGYTNGYGNGYINGNGNVNVNVNGQQYANGHINGHVNNSKSVSNGINGNADLKQVNLVGHPLNFMNNINNANQMNPNFQIPQNIMRPNNNETSKASNLGFQMNPVSKNKKK